MKLKRVPAFALLSLLIKLQETGVPCLVIIAVVLTTHTTSTSSNAVTQ